MECYCLKKNVLWRKIASFGGAMGYGSFNYAAFWGVCGVGEGEHGGGEILLHSPRQLRLLASPNRPKRDYD